MGQQFLKDCQAINNMKLLIVLGFLPLFSAASSFQFGSGRKFNQKALISTMETLAKNPDAAAAIAKIFNKDNICLRNMDEAIEGMKLASDMVKVTEGDLQALNNHVKSLNGLKGETEVVREVAELLRALKPVVEINPNAADDIICSPTTDNGFAYLRSLAVIMHEFSYDKEVATTKEARDMFHKSGNILSGLVAFLSQLKTQSKEFQNFCYPNKESAVRGISALANIIDSMADMFSTLGNYKAGEEIRKGKFFTQNIVNKIPLMNELNVGIHDCTVTDLDSAAQTLQDLASLVDEIGMEKLGSDLGVDISSFYFNNV